MLRRIKKEREQTRAEKRVARMSTHDLYAWAETSIVALGRGLDEHRRAGLPAEELVLGSEALLAVFTEIQRRESGGPTT